MLYLESSCDKALLYRKREVVAGGDNHCVVDNEGNYDEIPSQSQSANGWTPLSADDCRPATCNAVVDLLLVIPPDVNDWYELTYFDAGSIGQYFLGIYHYLAVVGSFEIAMHNSDVDMEINVHIEPFDFQYSPDGTGLNTAK